MPEKRERAEDPFSASMKLRTLEAALTQSNNRVATLLGQLSEERRKKNPKKNRGD